MEGTFQTHTGATCEDPLLHEHDRGSGCQRLCKVFRDRGEVCQIFEQYHFHAASLTDQDRACGKRPRRRGAVTDDNRLGIIEFPALTHTEVLIISCRIKDVPQSRVFYAVRVTDRDRVICRSAGVQHGAERPDRHGRENLYAAHLGEKRDVIDPVVRGSVGGRERRAINDYVYRQMLERNIMQDLVIPALEKTRINDGIRFLSACREPGAGTEKR